MKFCPRCQNGAIFKGTLKKDNSSIYFCDDCDATWEELSKINAKEFEDFEDFTKKNDLEYSNSIFNKIEPV